MRLSQPPDFLSTQREPVDAERVYLTVERGTVCRRAGADKVRARFEPPGAEGEIVVRRDWLAVEIEPSARAIELDRHVAPDARGQRARGVEALLDQRTADRHAETQCAVRRLWAQIEIAANASSSENVGSIHLATLFEIMATWRVIYKPAIINEL